MNLLSKKFRAGADLKQELNLALNQYIFLFYLRFYLVVLYNGKCPLYYHHSFRIKQSIHGTNRVFFTLLAFPYV